MRLTISALTRQASFMNIQFPFCIVVAGTVSSGCAVNMPQTTDKFRQQPPVLF
jgi:hypothetical protein